MRKIQKVKKRKKVLAKRKEKLINDILVYIKTSRSDQEIEKALNILYQIHLYNL